MAFPRDFVWGAASSAIQIEGNPLADGGGESVWDRFCSIPGKVADGATPNIACDSYHRYAQDVALLEEMGLNAYRFSTSWARIDPHGDGRWNAAGLAYYDRLVDLLLEKGIEPYVTLHHWELPQKLEERGGWLNPETARQFARFAGMVARHFRGRARRYFTLNEPQCVLNLGYNNGLHAPGRHLDQRGLFCCWKHLMMAHGLAMRAIKSSDEGAQVGLASTGRLCYPETDSPEDCAAAERATFRVSDDDWLFHHGVVLDAICKGRFAPCPGTRLETLARTLNAQDWKIIHCTPDFIGLNVYNGNCVRADGDAEVYVARPAGHPLTALKWPVTERVMNEGVGHIWKRYGLPIYITENGQSCNDRIFLDGAVHDPDRIDFLTRYLRELKKSAETADIRGYFHWSLTDNFEWHSGYGERFGLVYVDYSSQRRILKDSAYWYREVAASNGASLEPNGMSVRKTEA